MPYVWTRIRPRPHISAGYFWKGRIFPLVLGYVHSASKSFCAVKKIIPHKLLFTHMNGCDVTISVTERSCAAPISKVERDLSDRFFAVLWCKVNTYSACCGSKEVGVTTGTEVNIQEWGLESMSAPNPLGQPLQHDVCAAKLCSHVPLLFILY